MARQPDIQYIRYYTSGSAARQIELPKLPKRKPAAKKKPAQVRTLHLDPLPVAGILISCALLVCMILGAAELTEARQAQRQMQEYVQLLQEDKVKLEAQYRDGIDPEYIEQLALSMGLVPQEQVTHIQVQMSAQEAEEEPGFWHNVVHFLTGLFA